MNSREIVGSVIGSGRGQPKRFGEWLLAHGKITEIDLKRAVRALSNGVGPIGYALTKLGAVDELVIAESLAEMHKFSLVNAQELEPRREILAKIPEKLAQQMQVLPLKIEEKRLVVAVDKPLKIVTLRQLERTARMPIVQKIATSGALRNAIALSYTSDTVADSHGLSAIEVVEDIIVKAVKLKASDIHIEPLEERVRLRYRIDGMLRELESYTHDQFASVVSRIKVISGLNIAEKRSPQDGAISFERNGIEIDLRVSILPSLYGEKIVMRLLAGKTMQLTIDQIGLTQEVYEQFLSLVNRPYGIVMIVGPTGSGKSTTLSAALNTINSPEINIVTVEDPVEYKIPGVTQVHVGQNDKLTFAGALRSILRQDPDVIMVGETRDSETADISLRAALTGHMVFTTLHTNDAPGALPRLVDMGCEPFLVSSSVNGVLAQRLVRKLCRCAEPYEPSDEQLRLLSIPRTESAPHWMRPVGCDHCGSIGYRGRIGVFELLEVTEPIQRALMEGASTSVLTTLAIESGMRTLREDALDKLNNGVTSYDEVLRVTIG